MTHSSRQIIVTGNWKMNKTVEEAKDFIRALVPLTETSSTLIYLAVPFTAIYPLTQEFKDTRIIFGAQNMNDASSGAFTGEIAAKMLIEAGAKFVILGHSERRHLYHESNRFINRKVKRAVAEGIQPVLCIGETREEHEAGQVREVLKAQLTECLEELNADQLKNLIVSYEPVWAIGTGNTASPEMAEEVQQYCRSVLQELFDPEFAQRIVIQYGGSVTPANAKELLSQTDIDGLLVGGASLSLESFIQIVNDSQRLEKN
ncbi:MAG: triose-phosphate isomerase [Chlamydiales bacterium]